MSGVGTYSHHVDYRYGRVVFDNPIPSGTAVSCEYSYRMYDFLSASAPWWRQFQFNSYRVDDSTFLQPDSGSWGILAQNRIQLPAVVVEPIPASERRPLELGAYSQVVRQHVLFHVLAETPYDRNQLHDIITYQVDERIIMYDKNNVLQDEVFGLDAEGSPAVSGLMYPELISSPPGGYGWRQLRIKRFSSMEQPPKETAPLYMATIRGEFEVDMP